MPSFLAQPLLCKRGVHRQHSVHNFEALKTGNRRDFTNSQAHGTVLHSLRSAASSRSSRQYPTTPRPAFLNASPRALSARHTAPDGNVRQSRAPTVTGTFVSNIISVQIFNAKENQQRHPGLSVFNKKYKMRMATVTSSTIINFRSRHCPLQYSNAAHYNDTIKSLSVVSTTLGFFH